MILRIRNDFCVHGVTKKGRKKNRNVFWWLEEKTQRIQEHFPLNEVRHLVLRPSQCTSHLFKASRGPEDDVFSRGRGKQFERGVLLHELLSEIIPIRGRRKGKAQCDRGPAPGCPGSSSGEWPGAPLPADAAGSECVKTADYFHSWSTCPQRGRVTGQGTAELCQ